MKQSRSAIENVAVVGLDKVGAPRALTRASRAFRLFGVDISSDLVTKLNQAIAPVEGPGLQSMPKDSIGELRATSDYQEAILNSEGILSNVVDHPSQAPILRDSSSSSSSSCFRWGTSCFPSLNSTPARTSATRWGAFTLRQWS